MKIWKMKLQRRKKEGTDNAKSLEDNNVVAKRSRSLTSTIGIGCLTKSGLQTDDAAVSSGRSGSIATAVNSVNETTVTTSGSSSRAKRVRFDVVEIRDYERIAGDNPCCSSGPPIGIGWNHGSTRRETIENYEKNRGRRKQSLEIVLGRNEREALLLEWDVDMKTIATSTRAAMKTKFQRKQTVINSRKLSKLEEVIKLTSRRLKNIFLQKRRVNGAVNGSLAGPTSEIYASDYSRAGDTASITSAGEDDRSHLHVKEPDGDEIENLMHQSFGVPTDGVCNEDDQNASDNDDFTLGATTLGNTSAFSPSIIEMEKFYRELELEMFGEETELPSMVGQTLEVPLDNESANAKVTIADKANVHDKINVHKQAHSYPQTNHLERYSQQSFSHNDFRGDDYDNHAPIPVRDRYSAYDVPRVCQHDQPPLNHGRLLPFSDEDYEVSHSNISSSNIAYNNSMNLPAIRGPIAQRRSISFVQRRTESNLNLGPSIVQGSFGSQTVSYRQYRGLSFDSSDDVTLIQNSRYMSPTSQLEHAHSHFQSKPTLSVSSRDIEDFPFRYSDPGADHRFRPWSSQNQCSDEPQVRHMPMHGRLSANEWMDGTDYSCFVPNNDIGVTITEGHCSLESEILYR